LFLTVQPTISATELVPEDLGIKIQCAHCGLFVFKVSMRSHMQTHANSLKCDQCYKTFKSRKNLASHVWSAHTETPPEDFIKCQFCSQVYLKQIYMDRHLEKAHGNQQRQPPSESVLGQPQAESQQPTPPAVRTESATESTIKCDLCPKLFTRLQNLDRHMAKVHISKCKANFTIFDPQVLNQSFQTIFHTLATRAAIATIRKRDCSSI
jgi:uncharacterized C2H2 Zn-finger protein